MIFGRDMILPIKHEVDWELTCQVKNMQINRDNTQENKHRVFYDYKVGDKVMLTNHTAYKYKTPYKVPFTIMRCYTDGTVNLQCGPTKNCSNGEGIIPIYGHRVKRICAPILIGRTNCYCW